MTDRAIAARALACLDLTDLADDSTESTVTDLCRRAQTAHGPVAAVCVWPRFVPTARAALWGAGIRIATVVNFPAGGEAVDEVRSMTATALAQGANEIDLVLPYRAFAEGRADIAAQMVAAIRDTSKDATLKVILETGMLHERSVIRRAADLAIAEGADFIKTSTGKVQTNATLEATAVMLEAIVAAGRKVGLKPAGGIRSAADAAAYVAQADAAMGEGWAQPATFRLGASSVLTSLLAVLDGEAETLPSGQAY